MSASITHAGVSSTPIGLAWGVRLPQKHIRLSGELYPPGFYQTTGFINVDAAFRSNAAGNHIG
jgi:hypothetical protein